MAKTYRLRTIKDIFDKVPIDRIGDVLDELKILVEISAFAKGSSGVTTFIFPDEITWIDDGKGDIMVQTVDASTYENLLEVAVKTGGQND